jgi:hypothetical protein
MVMPFATGDMVEFRVVQLTAGLGLNILPRFIGTDVAAG